MFVGFVDGDGTIKIVERKYKDRKGNKTIMLVLSINLHERDLPLLEYFVETLGVGRIYKRSGLSQVVLDFGKTDLMNIIIPLMQEYNLKFLTVQRKSQFDKLMFILSLPRTLYFLIK